MSKSDYKVILFYKFVGLTRPDIFAKKHREKGVELGLLGRMIVAKEGINGTFEGQTKNINQYKKFLKSDKRFKDLIFKESAGNGKSFTKLSIKVRDEVVTLGAGRFNIKKDTAKEISAKQLENWYQKNEDFVVLDLRNSYEIASGAFDRTIDPGLNNFRDLPAKIEEFNHLKNKKVIAVCTGGIRCTKATCLLKKEGFADLYQLKDGIHTYMKEYPAKHFRGTLFVFDNRMTTDVVSSKRKVIIGRCTFCQVATEKYYSDDRFRPSRKVLCCSSCLISQGSHLRSCDPVLK